MYEDYEEPVSFSEAFEGALTIGYIIAFILIIIFFITKLRERKLHATLIDFLKLIWMIVSVIIVIWFLAQFFPEFTFNAAEEKLFEFMPIKTGILGVITNLLISVSVSIFCLLGIVFYFVEPQKKNNPPIE